MENQTTQSQSVSESVADISTQPSVAGPSLISKKVLSIAAVVLLVIVGIGLAAYMILGRSGSGTTPESRAITLTYWGLWEPSDALSGVINEFQAQNPGVTIQYSQQSPRDYRERLLSAFSRSQGPDIFRFHNTWVPMLSQSNVLSVMPTTVMSTATFESTFYPQASSDLKTQSGVVGVPLMTDGLGLYINKRMLTASGRTVPTTWDELRSLGIQLTVRSQDGASIERSGLALGSANNVDHFSDVLGVLILQNGGNPGVVDSLVSDGLTFYTQFVRQDKVWDETLPNSTYAFAIEKAAMIIAPSWRAFEIKQINPNFEFEIHPIPQLPGNPVTWASYWAEGVSQSSPEKEMAWKFVEYLSHKETLEKLYQTATSSRAFGEVYSRRDMKDALTSDPYAGAYVKQAETARSWYMASRTFDNGLNDQIIKYYQDAVNGLNTGKRMEEVTQTLSQGVAQVLATFGVRTQ